MEPNAARDSDQEEEIYILKGGQILGPFSADDLRAGLERGEFSMAGFVQQGGLPLWQPVSRFLDPRVRPEHRAIAPDWRSIMVWAAVRLRYDVGAGSLVLGLVCVAIGVLLVLLARWPMTFWLPWFLVPIVTALFAMKQNRPLAGFSLLLVVAAVPVVFSLASRDDSPRRVEPIVSTTISATPRPPEPPALPALEQPLERPQRPAEVAPVAVVAPPAVPVVAAAAESAPSSINALAATPPALPPLPPLRPGKPMEASAPSAFEGDLVQRYAGALILVKSSEGSGSGFICKADGQTRLLTNIHLVAGMKVPQFTALNGSQLRIGASEAAVGRDIFRTTLASEPAAALPLIDNLESSVKIGDDVVVLGNSGGGGVVTKLEDKLVGIGPDRIEVSAEFIPGNSGSPIIHVPTGQVIGIATYLTRRYEEFTSNTRSTSQTPTVRRFGYRVDKVPQWQPVNWATFQGEAEQLRRIEQLTGDVFAFLGSLRKKTQADFATDTLRRPATQWLATIKRAHLSAVDREQATRGFLGSLRAMVRSDVISADGQLRYTYFRDELTRQREVRDRLYEAFDEDAKRLASTTGRGGY